MQVSVENVSNVERRVTITIPASQVEEAYTKQINLFAQNAKIDGFRPGKAPIAFIQKRFGAEARREALNEVIQKALDNALTVNKLRPITVPQVEPKIMAPEQPLEFVASFEVLPEIGHVQFAVEQLEKSVVEITAEDIDRVLGQLQKQYTHWEAVEREAQVGDRVVIDYYAIFEGKSDIENKLENFPLELGSKSMLEGFEEGLVGTKAGDERTLSLKFPDNFGVADKAGKPVEFKVTVKQVLAADKPPMDEKLVQQLGVKSGKKEDLENQIRQTLTQERDRLVSEKLKEQVFSRLLEQNALDIPKSLIAREAKNIHDEVYQHQHDHNHSGEEMAMFEDIAKKRVAMSLLINEYAKQNNIKPEAARVEKRIQEIASAYEKPQEVAAWLSTPERRSGLEAQILEDQVLEKLLEGVTLVEKTMSYADLRGVRI